MRGRRQYLLGVATTIAGAVTAGCASNEAPSGADSREAGGSPAASPDGSDPATDGTPAEGTMSPSATPPPLDVPESLPDPALGDPDAPVTVDAYEDFACPYCREYHATSFPRLREEYVDAGTVRYVFHDSPKVSNESWRMAGAARAVQHDAGDDAFWPFADAMYEHAAALLEAADLGRIASETTGADGTFVRRAVEEGAFRAFLREQREAAIDRGADTVPTILVEGRKVPWDYSALSAAIDAEL